MKQFLFYYLRSMRLYYSFVTGVTVLAGLATFPRLFEEWDWRCSAVLMIGFAAWGVNQIFSDWLDRKEDALNAPHRPMVSGKLSPRPALLMSAAWMGIFALLVCVISPKALLILLVGGVLNYGYSICKPVPVLNCVVYALAISCCYCLGAEVRSAMTVRNIFVALISVFPAHVLMCSFSYYKDKTGDRSAGIRTLQTLVPDHMTLPLHALAGTAYSFYLFRCSPVTPESVILFFTQMIVLVLLICRLSAQKYHSATCLNCELCVLWLFSVCCAVEPQLFWGAVGSFILIVLLFRWYPDEKE